MRRALIFGCALVTFLACGGDTSPPGGVAVPTGPSATPSSDPDANGLAIFQFRDLETGTIWNIKGEAVTGPLAGQQLERVGAYSAYWFSWASFWPQTAVHGQLGGAQSLDPATVQSAVPLGQILGDVPIDAIPPLDVPRKDQGEANFVAVQETAHVSYDEIVVGVEFDGDARAYPVRIMNWHEIVNHTVGSRKISLTYCPLTASGVAYDAASIEFGNSGSLFNNNMVMYDRTTRSLWPQMRANVIAGDAVPSKVDLLPVFQGRWDPWKALYPESRVLTRETGFVRDYSGDIYIQRGYTMNAEIWFAQAPAIDERFHPKEMVLGLLNETLAKAYPFSTLQDIPVVNDNFGGKDIVIAYCQQGAMAVPFHRVVDGRSLTFEPLP